VSEWFTNSINAGDTLENRDECWNLAKQNVPSAVGIHFNYDLTPNCMAIDDASTLMPWPSSFPNRQLDIKLCILRSYIEKWESKTKTTGGTKVTLTQLVATQTNKS
jgi:hypothetical protein